MTSRKSAHSLILKYRQELVSIQQRRVELESDARKLDERESELLVVVDALVQALGTSADFDPATTPQGTSTPPRRRRGRKKSSSVDISSLGVVGAAVYLARHHGIVEADSATVHGWLTSAGFSGRNGPPTRNTVNVSLNREASKSGGARVVKVGRGVFKFEVTGEVT